MSAFSETRCLPLLVLCTGICADSPTIVLNLLVSLPYLSTRNANKSEDEQYVLL
jgi:hypothetical protein